MNLWIIVGASRGIGRELVRQILAREDRVIATVRDVQASPAVTLWGDMAAEPERCQVCECDITSEQSITKFASFVKSNIVQPIDYVVLNAGVLKYPSRSIEASFDQFALHLHTNTIGPIITAQKLIGTGIPIGTMTFISSDSASQGRFRAMEDGLAAYAASKSALNMALRHMAEELKTAKNETTILAVHPGEVLTDMANYDISWEVDRTLTPEQSVKQVLEVIESKDISQSGTFWTWENEEYVW